MPKKYDASRRPGETPMQHYRRLAKVADQRLVRLEKLAGQEGYKNILKWSYRRAQKNINYYSGEQNFIASTATELNAGIEKGWTPGRFNTKPPTTKTGQIDMRSLKAKIRDIQEFLETPTSKKADIEQTYNQRVHTLNERFPGNNFKWEDLADFFESDAYKNLRTIYDSGEILEFRSAIKGNEDALAELLGKKEEDIVKALAENSEINLHVEDEVVKDTIISLLADNNLDLLQLSK